LTVKLNTPFLFDDKKTFRKKLSLGDCDAVQIVEFQPGIKRLKFSMKPLARERRRSLLRFVFGIFIVLHGLVHLLYFGQSRRLFELQPGMVWPDGSWAFSKLLGNEVTRLLASIFCVLAAISFVAGGTGILVRQAWWRPVVVGSAAFSAVIFILFWDGEVRKLADKGGVALLINLAILVAVLIF
jgi:hypothetical protein